MAVARGEVPEVCLGQGAEARCLEPAPGLLDRAARNGDEEGLAQVRRTLDAMADRHMTGKALFDALGKYAPAFGMIGTLVGLVVMLQNMDDPSKIGPGMAIALLTTLYGSLLANVVALPVADKLALRSAEEMVVKNIILRGIMSIQAGDNPRVVEQKLRSFLPPSMRVGEEEAQAA